MYFKAQKIHFKKVKIVLKNEINLYQNHFLKNRINHHRWGVCGVQSVKV